MIKSIIIIIIIENEERYLLSDVIHFHIPQPSFHVLSFQELGRGMGGDKCSKSYSANPSKKARNVKKLKI